MSKKVRIPDTARKIVVTAVFAPRQDQSGMPVASEDGSISMAVNFSQRFNLTVESPLKEGFNAAVAEGMAPILELMNDQKIPGMPDIIMGHISTAPMLNNMAFKVVFPVNITLSVPADVQAVKDAKGYFTFFTDGLATVENIEPLGWRLCHPEKTPAEWLRVGPGEKRQKERRFDGDHVDLATSANAAQAAEG